MEDDTGKKTHINIQLRKLRRISKEGLSQWTRKNRGKVSRIVTDKLIHYTHNKGNPIAVEDIEDMEKLKNFFFEHCDNGKWIMSGNCFCKTSKMKRKWVPLATAYVEIRDELVNIKLVNCWRLKRYWFWKAKDKSKKLV